MLEAENIRNKRFSTVKNGCSPSEVTEYLAMLAQEIEELQRANAESEEKILKLVEKINEYREDEDAIKAAMIYAQKESNKLINDAKAKARDMIESAKTEQVRLSEQSAAECERIIQEHKAKCDEMIQQQTEDTRQEILAIQDEYDAEKARLDEMKAEVTYFKSQLTDLYTQQLALILRMPQMSEEELDEYEQANAEYYDEDEEYENDDAEEQAAESAAEEAAAREKAEQERLAEQKLAEQKHIDEVLNTASFKPIIPKADASELQFGKNTSNT